MKAANGKQWSTTSQLPRRRRLLINTILVWTFFLISTYFFRRDNTPNQDQVPASNSGHRHRPPFAAPSTQESQAEQQQDLTPIRRDNHPISKLIEDAQREQLKILAKQTHTLQNAAAAYRERRGRHPPPGFASWFNYANARNTIVVEDFWDLIYHDLKPFWAVDARRLRRQADSWTSIRIRKGAVQWRHHFFWCENTAELIQKFAEFLPDLDISMNLMDEPRVIVPWEDMNDYVKRSEEARIKSSNLPLSSYKRDFSSQTTTHFDTEDEPRLASIADGWDEYEGDSDKSYWPKLVKGCPPDSPARLAYETAKATRTWTSADVPARPIDFLDLDAVSKRKYATHGFIHNYTGLTDLCAQPELEFLHGGIINPLLTSYKAELIPFFGGSKMSVHNEITIPAPMHYAKNHGLDIFEDESRDASKKTEDLWPNMSEIIMWRGITSGGWAHPKNWRGFHRHRFLAMTNPDQLEGSDWGWKSDTWLVLNDTSIPAIKKADMQEAISRSAVDHNMRQTWEPRLRAGFTNEPCTNKTTDNVTGVCDMAGAFRLGDREDLRRQFQNKYLPDIDGNSYSGRFRAFMLSDTVPIKATIYREWFDLRIMPWIHFVPMSNTYHEFYAIMEYFFGYKSKNTEDALASHDQEALLIAKSGREWSEKVMRREDQEVYMFRLLLEYARVLEDERDSMGFIDDLL